MGGNRILETLNDVLELIGVQFGITDGTAYRSSKEMAAREHGKRPDSLVFQRARLSDNEIAEVEKLLLQADKDAETRT